MRLSIAKFFLARGGGLVGSDESMILDCYRLAKFYAVSPDIFLNMPMTEMHLHLYRTTQLMIVLNKEQNDG